MVIASPMTAPAPSGETSNANNPKATVSRPVPRRAITWAENRFLYVRLRRTVNMIALAQASADLRRGPCSVAPCRRGDSSSAV